MFVHVINPGLSTLKLACAEIGPSREAGFPGRLGLRLVRQEVPLSPDLPLEELSAQVLAATADWPAPVAVAGRAGWLGRVPGGVYLITPELADLASRSTTKWGDPTAQLGVPLALAVAQARGVAAYTVDPQGLDELLPEAAETGVPGVRREAYFHALNARLVARRAAYEVGKRLSDARVVVAHLGATTSVTAFDRGRAIDTTGTAPDGGPMGTRQSGPLPTRAVIELLGTQEPAELMRRLTRDSGVQALSGGLDLAALETQGHAPGVPVLATLVQQVCRAIGEQAAALPGRPDVIALTGRLAQWEAFVSRVEGRLGWVAPFALFPGELETEALAEGVGRALLGLEGVREWSPAGTVLRAATPLAPLPPELPGAGPEAGLPLPGAAL